LPSASFCFVLLLYKYVSVIHSNITHQTGALEGLNTITPERKQQRETSTDLQWPECPGRNGIDYLIIRNLPTEALEILLQIYNDILRARVLPDDWKKYRAFFIPKRDKTNVRPISMSSCVCKVRI
jgi:hypothetical protein